ncbi:Metal tolerance protein 2 [Acorus calamus]|uniref:Metal tolerance protein 2 n=1 Tax=Acorus calamus TaxID=4465 RepID=A0AAV9EDV2_ACOCL|nr:Metal tolerance protein 2 [Acorus calamus]
MPGWWMLPFVEVDVKKIVSRVIERARELCISKSFESLGALGISGVLLLTSGGIAWHAIDVLKSFIMSAGGINLGLKFLDSLAGIIISGMILKAGLEIAYQRTLKFELFMEFQLSTMQTIRGVSEVRQLRRLMLLHMDCDEATLRPVYGEPEIKPKQWRMKRRPAMTSIEGAAKIIVSSAN